MKHLLLTSILLWAYVCVNAQDITEKDEPVDVIIIEHSDSSVIVRGTELDEQPIFPGGVKALMEFLSTNIEYPSECVKKRIEGKVIVHFTIFKDGSVGNIGLSKSVYPDLDAEAMRVVKLLPKWIPGKLDGKPVNVWFDLPISFKL